MAMLVEQSGSYYPTRMAPSPHVTVTLSRALIDLFPGAPTRVDLRAESVAALIAALDASHPGMADRIVDETPAIRRHLNVFVDGTKATLATPLAAGSQVYILTAMSGG